MGTLNRGTGLLVIEVRCSNPNGDPDAESDPRTFDTDGRGLISPVSFKRKLRDLVAEKKGPVWEAAAKELSLEGSDRAYEILESRGRRREEIGKLDRDAESDARRPVIPTEGGHPIRSKAATDSDRRRPPC